MVVVAYLGFQFTPTDEELICHYLWRKQQALPHRDLGMIKDIELYDHHPKDLFNLFQEGIKNKFKSTSAYFFTTRNRKYPNGSRPARLAQAGNWRSSNKTAVLKLPDDKTGFKTSLFYYIGKYPNGKKTGWLMQEYSIEKSEQPKLIRGNHNPLKLEDWVLCRVYYKEPKEEREGAPKAVVEEPAPPHLADEEEATTNVMRTEEASQGRATNNQVQAQAILPNNSRKRTENQVQAQAILSNKRRKRTTADPSPSGADARAPPPKSMRLLAPLPQCLPSLPGADTHAPPPESMQLLAPPPQCFPSLSEAVTLAPPLESMHLLAPLPEFLASTMQCVPPTLTASPLDVQPSSIFQLQGCCMDVLPPLSLSQAPMMPHIPPALHGYSFSACPSSTMHPYACSTSTAPHVPLSLENTSSEGHLLCCMPAPSSFTDMVAPACMPTPSCIIDMDALVGASPGIGLDACLAAPTPSADSLCPWRLPSDVLSVSDFRDVESLLAEYADLLS